MFFSGGAKDPSGNPAGPASVVDNAQSNRILLILAGVLVLLIFMDFQARRHYSALADSIGTSQAGAARDHLEQAASSLGEPIQIQAEALLGAADDQGSRIIEEAGNTAGTARESIGDALSEALSEDNLREVAGDAATAAGETAAELARSRNLNPGEVGEIPAVVPVAAPATIAPPESIYLYFIRFRNSRSELVRVSRPASTFRLNADGELALTEVLAQLKQGPTPHEAGLINAFDRRVKINNVRLNRENGMLELDLNEAVGRLGKHVIRDRLDQLAFTLTQFPEVGGVRLRVNGESVTTIGSQGFKLAPILRPSNRIYHNFE
ncbi:MAG: GerMN domain-containing protein [bacterium]|nr:GerMN domain-containing protein [bacterium]